MNATRKRASLAILGFAVLVTGFFVLFGVVVIVPASTPPNCVSSVIGYCGIYLNNDTVALILIMAGYFAALLSAVASVLPRAGRDGPSCYQHSVGNRRCPMNP